MSLRSTKRRKRLSMTSLIDVIFLLLLFFMLSSTFSRFAEVELTAGGTQGAAAATPAETRILFLRLTETGMTLNGQPIGRTALVAALEAGEGGETVLVSVTRSATAQTLTDVLVDLRAVPRLNISVLEAS